MKLKLIIITLAALSIAAAFADVRFVNHTDHKLTGKIFWLGGTLAGTRSQVEIPAREDEWAKGDVWNIKEKIQVLKDNKVVAEVDPRTQVTGGGGNLRVDIHQGATPESFNIRVKQTFIGE